MEVLRWKTRIALLWVVMVVANFVHGMLATWEPGGLEKLIAHMKEVGAGGLLFEALLALIPLWLAFVTMSVKDSYNRWVNFALGIVFTILNIMHFFECGIPLRGGPIAEPTAHHILLVGSTVVVTALIAWYAWKWPKQQE